jgi:hypothetical protein
MAARLSQQLVATWFEEYFAADQPRRRLPIDPEHRVLRGEPNFEPPDVRLTARY